MWERPITHNKYLFNCILEQNDFILCLYEFQHVRVKVISWHAYAGVGLLQHIPKLRATSWLVCHQVTPLIWCRIMPFKLRQFHTTSKSPFRKSTESVWRYVSLCTERIGLLCPASCPYVEHNPLATITAHYKTAILRLRNVQSSNIM